MNKAILMASLCAACSLTLAQESGPQGREKKRRDYIEEVIVTATKKAESIQDVPLSVSVLSGERMKNTSIESFEDVSQASPNTDINMTPGYVQVGMRGLNSPINDGMEQSVGFYVDGVYYGKTAFLQDAFLDLQRVELLKGPQGTLFGKNTVAGAINVTTASPDYEPAASVTYTAGDLDTRQADVMVNLPLVADRLALRVAATSSSRDGYVKNVLRGGDEKSVDKDGIRAKLLFDINDRISTELTHYRGSSADTGQGWEPFVLQGAGLLVHSLFDPNLEDRFDYRSHTNSDNRNRFETELTNWLTNWDLGEHTLTFIASRAESDEVLYLDADTASAPVADWFRDFQYEQNMLELRLASGPGKVEYLIGVFGFWSETQQAGDLRMLPEGPLSGLVGPALETLLGLGNLLTSPLLSPVDALLNSLTTDALIQNYQLDTRTTALFSQVTWHLSERLSLVGGLRASQETKEVFLDQDYEATGLLLQAAFGVSEYTLDASRDESNVAPKLALKYAVGDDDMLYASYAEGFKAGGYNPLARNPSEAEFDQEYAQAYELGYKMTALEGALVVNSALYLTQFEDMQIQAFIGNGFLVSNAAEATTQGLEVDVNYQPFAGTSLFASMGIADATFDEFKDGPCQAGSQQETCDLSGERLPRSSEYSANLGGTFVYPLFDNSAALFLGADVSWRSDLFFDLDVDPIDSQDAYHLINLHVGIIDPDQRWKFLVHAKNLQDRKVRRFTADLPIFDGSHMGFLMPPRIITADINYTF
ncbi:TonB-dependent receptor [Spongiibacter nanhainus]|uniref:TonB-dependent receptor n=1 Tax=Spongiibacter nanhainus TaxID=2794344 RepID=A0A7T4UR25_9GAMM|nr:TonB-dependent receptor [Spongiibacter nanhainus]QQD17915.1 TonB-dependent receptor [Spongiibacter nanhainus]